MNGTPIVVSHHATVRLLSRFRKLQGTCPVKLKSGICKQSDDIIDAFSKSRSGAFNVYVREAGEKVRFVAKEVDGKVVLITAYKPTGYTAICRAKYRQKIRSKR